MSRTCGILMLICALLAMSTAAFAVMLDNEDSETTIIASVGAQAQVSVPDEIDFDVTNVTVDTNCTGLTVSATSIVLNDGDALRIELKADTANFTKPAGATATWAASDVSWNAPVWVGGTGAAGTLSSAGYTKIAESTANASTLSNSTVTWTLADRAIDRAGAFSLTTTWKFSSFTPD